MVSFIATFLKVFSETIFDALQYIDLIQSSTIDSMKMRLWGIDLPCFQWHPLY